MVPGKTIRSFDVFLLIEHFRTIHISSCMLHKCFKQPLDPQTAVCLIPIGLRNSTALPSSGCTDMCIPTLVQLANHKTKSWCTLGSHQHMTKQNAHNNKRKVNSSSLYRITTLITVRFNKKANFTGVRGWAILVLLHENKRKQQHPIDINWKDASVLFVSLLLCHH